MGCSGRRWAMHLTHAGGNQLVRAAFFVKRARSTFDQMRQIFKSPTGDQVNVGDWVRILKGPHIGRRGKVLEVDGRSVFVKVTANADLKSGKLRLGPDQFRPAKFGTRDRSSRA